MRSRVLRSLFLLTLILLVCIGTFAQVESAEAGRLLVAKIAPSDQSDFNVCSRAGISGEALGLDVLYQGQKPLRAYVVAVYYTTLSDPPTEEYRTESRVIFPYQPTIVPGAKWHSVVCGLSSDADLNSARAEVDLLAFNDDSVIGPVNLRESNHLYGVFAGMDFVTGQSIIAKSISPQPVTNTGLGKSIASDDASLPLEFAGVVARDDSGQSWLTVEATNTGAAPVIAYEYKVSFFDHLTGALVKSVTTKTLNTQASSPNYLLPGAVWASGARKIPVSASGALDSYKIRLDTVILLDGTILGPRRSRESDELVGMIEGMNIAKSMSRVPK